VLELFDTTAAAAAVPFQATLAEDEYTALCERVRRLSCIDLLQYKRDQMERRVRAWVRRRGSVGLAVYAELLRRDADELDAFLDHITINVSGLWRHATQWELLRRDVLPGLAAARGGHIRAWSAGCSYGAEAYTLAALCREALPSATVDIRGTDLDRRMVERARGGRFSTEDARCAPPEVLARHFEPVPRHGWQAGAALRAMVRFEVRDLLRMPADPAERGSYDLVLCRNTAIYFTEAVRDALHGRLAGALRPGGYLVLGTSERIGAPGALALAPPVEFVYRKIA
jgi:chemotaxis protein methyltransferase CheR